MNDLKKHALALSFIAILFSLKFILIPIIDWQNEQINSVLILERKIAKIENLLLSDDLFNEQHTNLSNALSNIEHGVFSYQEESTFQLQQQKIVESDLLKNALKISSIGWGNVVELDGLPLLQYPLEYRITGKTNKIIEYLIQLKTQDKLPDIKALNLSFRNQNQGELGSISARVRVTYYMFKSNYAPYIEVAKEHSLIKKQQKQELLK
jgi:hypothetical protein